jgi:hypothetical protein
VRPGERANEQFIEKVARSSYACKRYNLYAHNNHTCTHSARASSAKHEQHQWQLPVIIVTVIIIITIMIIIIIITLVNAFRRIYCDPYNRCYCHYYYHHYRYALATTA